MEKVQSTLQSKDFRQDINGLRAWAVMAVVLYHFAVPGFSGGFAGVDVFFVISGFLMAGIVVGGINRGNFSLLNFYMARARRIIPALWVVVLVVLIIGAFALMPSDYQKLGKHARESLFFTSNLRYLKESGYFDVSSHEKWLLHTWSLSVEWQFYIVYPIIIVLLNKFFTSRKFMLVLHGVLFLVSFVISVCWVSNAPEKSFYLLPSRAWELLLGGLLFFSGGLVFSREVRLLLECCGLALILSVVVFVDASYPWPGALALLPTAGATLVLLARHSNSLLTGSGLFQWLGERSYSIYLWHWPLMVLITYYELKNDALWVAAAIALSLVLSDFSYRFVENPARRWLGLRSNAKAFAWLLCGVAVLAMCAQIVRRDGIPWRLPAEVARIDAERHNTNPRQDECLTSSARCIFGGPDIQALVIGDSHADATVMAIQDSLPNATTQGIALWVDSGCAMIEGAGWFAGGHQGCHKMRAELFSKVDELYPGKPIIVINRLTAYAMGAEFGSPEVSLGKPMVYFSRKVDRVNSGFLAEFRQAYISSMCKLSEKHDVYALMPIPDMPSPVPVAMGKAFLKGQPVDISITADQYRIRNGFIRGIMNEAVSQCGVKLLDPTRYLCDSNKCYGSKDGLPLYVDGDHLSMRGNRLLIPLFKSVFANSTSK